MESYEISFRFRGEHRKGYVHDHGDMQQVFFSDETILNESAGCPEFKDKKYRHGYIRSNDIKDLADLVAAVEKQLR